MNYQYLLKREQVLIMENSTARKRENNQKLSDMFQSTVDSDTETERVGESLKNRKIQKVENHDTKIKMFREDTKSTVTWARKM